jgi:Ca2+-binding EF-hand superfamily protein
MRFPLLTAAIFVAFEGVSVHVPVQAHTAAEAEVAAFQGNARGRGQSQAAARQRFREMDQNGDGSISRAEWRGSDQSFRVHDWNRDGVLSGTELREAVRQSQSADPNDFDNVDTLTDWSANRFSALDRNRDRRITRDEWLYDLDSFRRADRDRDNVLTRTEFLGGDFDDDRGDRFDFLDVDGNNRVTRQEWHASDEAFNWLDTNRDGTLSRQEVEGADADSQADLFGRLDSNRDNRVSRAEWQWSRTSFDQLDANGDGVLSRREMNGAVAKGTSETATIGVGGTTRWIDTGIYVYAGDMIRFQARGSIQMSTDGADIADPAGARSNRRASSAPLPLQPAGALIARIDQGRPILVGSTTTAIRMSQTGRLFLSVNDDHLDDNIGEFQVVVNVQRRATE